MLGDMAYHLIISLLEMFMWDGVLEGAENLQDGPAVIVANHMGSIGPVGICSSLPMRLYPWVDGATVDPVKAADQIRVDFVEKTLKIKPPLSGVIAHTICKISTPLLLSLGCIPVPDTHEAQQATFNTSLQLLKDGKFLLIVPEDTDSAPDPVTGICPFKRGFLRLGELYASETRERLPFYPVVIHESGLVVIGKPIEYNPLNNPKMERFRMVNLLEESIKSMHMEVTQNQLVQPIFFKRKI
jgi:1-acyl-sn-glycerol-3-phosphate acyltransferase